MIIKPWRCLHTHCDVRARISQQQIYIYRCGIAPSFNPCIYLFADASCSCVGSPAIRHSTYVNVAAYLVDAANVTAMTSFADVMARMMEDDTPPDVPAASLDHPSVCRHATPIGNPSSMTDSDADTLQMGAHVDATSTDHGSVMPLRTIAQLSADHTDSHMDANVQPGTTSSEAFCAATEIDPESECTTTESEKTESVSASPKRRRFWRNEYTSPPRINDDDLLDNLEHAMNQPSESSPSPWSSWDSQDTRNDDPCKPDIQELQEPTHWSMEETFQRDARDLLGDCTNRWWYRGTINCVHIGSHLDFTLALEQSINFIRANVQSLMTQYKIGITCCPVHRYDGNTKHAYHRDPRWSNMKILWVCVHSRKDRPDSSGKFETLLVDVFNTDTCEHCINRPKSGGDCPARGSPNTVYVVW